jgi:hypothetical protein
MRKKLLAVALGVIFFACFNSTAAHATQVPLAYNPQPPLGYYPVGAFTLSAVTYPGYDVGTVSGRLFFDVSSNLIFANIAFNDLTVGKVFTFTNPGPKFLMTSPEIVGAYVFNALDPNQYFSLILGFPHDSAGVFALSICGVPYPCGTYMQIDTGGPRLTTVRVQGNISPVPEPGTLILLGTGALAVFGYRRSTPPEKV